MAIIEATSKQENLLYINVNEEYAIPNLLPNLSVVPLFLDRQAGIWVIFVKFDPGCMLPTHFHTGVVQAYTIKGQWWYLEHPDDVQGPGSYLYEPGGSVHSLQVPADQEGTTDVFFVVSGANVNFVGDDFMGIMDAGWIEDTILGAVKDGKAPMPRYLRPAGGTEFSR